MGTKKVVEIVSFYAWLGLSVDQGVFCSPAALLLQYALAVGVLYAIKTTTKITETESEDSK